MIATFIEFLSCARWLRSWSKNDRSELCRPRRKPSIDSFKLQCQRTILWFTIFRCGLLARRVAAKPKIVAHAMMVGCQRKAAMLNCGIEGQQSLLLYPSVL